MSCHPQSFSLLDRSSHRSHWARWAEKNLVPRQVWGLWNCLTRPQGNQPNPLDHRLIQTFKNFKESTWLYWCSKGEWWGRGWVRWKRKISENATDDKNILFVEQNLCQCNQELGDDLNTCEGLPTYVNSLHPSNVNVNVNTCEGLPTYVNSLQTRVFLSLTPDDYTIWMCKK